MHKLNFLNITLNFKNVIFLRVQNLLKILILKYKFFYWHNISLYIKLGKSTYIRYLKIIIIRKIKFSSISALECVFVLRRDFVRKQYLINFNY